MFLLILRQSKNQLAEWKVDFSDHETEHQCQWCCEPAGSSEVEVCGVFTESGVFETETSFLWFVAVNPSRLCHLSQTEAKQETRFCVCVMQTSKRYSAGRRTEVRVWLQSLWDRISKRPRLKETASQRRHLFETSSQSSQRIRSAIPRELLIKCQTPVCEHTETWQQWVWSQADYQECLRMSDRGWGWGNQTGSRFDCCITS